MGEKSDPLKNHVVTVGRQGNGTQFDWYYMEGMKLLYRVLGVVYIIFFFIYFAFRAIYSLGEKQLPYRVFVLVVEFLASISVCFVVFVKIRNPWENQYVGQADGAAHLTKKIQGHKEKAATSGGLKMGKELKKRDSLDQGDVSLFTPSRDEYGRVRNDESEMSRRDSVNSELDDARSLKREVLPEKAEYIVRVLVPCYKEDVGIVKGTLLAAVDQAYPSDKLFVYLCDDGKDPLKEEFVKSQQALGKNMHYVTRPEKYKGHGKAGNLNYCLRKVIYRGQGKKISKKELVVIFDADMVCNPWFTARLLPYFRENKKCVMVQTPQTFHNVPMQTDFFDAHNVNFFQYMLPAMSAWNTTTCCGTNFMVSARALSRSGWFPTLSVTEDMYLAMKLLEKGGIVKYHAENLVVGEAPMDMRQIFQQRSRWAKGTMQIAFKDNPLASKRLNWIQKLSFWNACWSYITSAFMNPLFVLINALGITFGLYPVTDIEFVPAMLFVSYYSLFYIMIHFNPVPRKHYLSLWIVGKMGHFFSFMALKAILNVIKSSFGTKAIDFKVTKKKVMKDKPVTATTEHPQSSDQEESKSNHSETESAHPSSDGDGEDDDDDFSIVTDEDAEPVDLDNEYEYETESAATRDSSKRDVVFHGIMSAFILFVIVYGVWIIFDGIKFLPEVKDERSSYQKKGIRVFGISWMIQFLIAYSLPLVYAYLPNKLVIQTAYLKVVSIVDTILSISLIVLTVALFKFNFIKTVPKISSIVEFPPADRAYWVSGKAAHKGLERYILETASDKKIPIVVIYERPERDLELFSAGGASSFSEYNSLLKDVADRLSEINFPSIVIMEPDWMQECMDISSTARFTTGSEYTIQNNITLFELINPEGQRYRWDSEKWYNLIDSYIDFANKLHPLTNVYIDSGTPAYLAYLGMEPVEKLYASIAGTRFRGVSINVANFFPSRDILRVGDYLHKQYGLAWVEDSSRNGGVWSTNSTWDEINSCRFDPPFLAYGKTPSWTVDMNEEDKELVVLSGMDAGLWVKAPGESDGRLYAPGEFHDCLMNHNIKCDQDQCPEVPPVTETGIFVRSVDCLCDS
jgi:cellulose synthase/poly-beta-1,6-N-acetylglucosamine synthase-like glycosyltransferase